MANDGSSAPEQGADQRGRRIAVVSHCLVNVNCKVEGFGPYVGVHPLIVRLAEEGVGVIQLPCPELAACGLRRWGQTREQLDHPAFRRECAAIAEDAAQQLEEYRRCGYDIVGMVGVEGSPSCGLERSASGDWGGEHDPQAWASVVSRVGLADRPGLLVAALQARLAPLGVPFFAIDESEDGHRVDAVLEGISPEPPPAA